MAELGTRTFRQFRRYIYQHSGILLGEDKGALLEARLSKHMRALNMSDYQQYLRYVQSDHSGDELVRMLDMITTNVTFFFRENNHFLFLKRLVGEWLDQGQTRFRLWSAACSSGEEPYSMAMAIHDQLKGRRVDLKILATDLSTRILQKSSEGFYEEEKLKDMTSMQRQGYFDKVKEEDKVYFRVKKEIRDYVVFRRLNLSTPPFPMQGPMDVVFCRNVMIYFDERVRNRLLAEMYRLIKPGGHLIVGHSESLSGLYGGFLNVKPSVFVKK